VSVPRERSLEPEATEMAEPLEEPPERKESSRGVHSVTEPVIVSGGAHREFGHVIGADDRTAGTLERSEQGRGHFRPVIGEGRRSGGEWVSRDADVVFVGDAQSRELGGTLGCAGHTGLGIGADDARATGFGSGVVPEIIRGMV
jgi:hypothetical protein